MMTVSPRIAPAETSAQFLATKCDYFVDVQLWPLRQALDPRSWLSNFTVPEQEQAVHLLNAFVYFRQALMDQMFVAAFQSLSMLLGCARQSFVEGQATWRSFNSRLLVTHVTGETPNPADSGARFVRMARQLLNIDESRILPPEHVLDRLVRKGPHPVVFFDDFVGSGQQMIATWGREYPIDRGTSLSFQRVAAASQADFFFCPLVSTKTAADNIKQHCPELQMAPANVIGDEYSVCSPNSIIWPDRLKAGASDFIVSASNRAGIPAHVHFGFNALGLVLAFEHCVPDATIPLLWWKDNGWHPLIRRV